MVFSAVTNYFKFWLNWAWTIFITILASQAESVPNLWVIEEGSSQKEVTTAVVDNETTNIRNDNIELDLDISEPQIEYQENTSDDFKEDSECINVSITLGHLRPKSETLRVDPTSVSYDEEKESINDLSKVSRNEDETLEKDDDEVPWLGAARGAHLTRCSGMQNLLDPADDSLINNFSEVFEKEKSKLISKVISDENKLPEILEEEKYSASVGQSEDSEKIWASLVARYSNENLLKIDSPQNKTDEQNFELNNEDLEIKNNIFTSPESSITSEEFSNQVEQRLQKYLDQIEESNDNKEAGILVAEESQEMIDKWSNGLVGDKENQIFIMFDDGNSDEEMDELVDDLTKIQEKDDVAEHENLSYDTGIHHESNNKEEVDIASLTFSDIKDQDLCKIEIKNQTESLAIKLQSDKMEEICPEKVDIGSMKAQETCEIEISLKTNQTEMQEPNNDNLAMSLQSDKPDSCKLLKTEDICPEVVSLDQDKCKGKEQGSLNENIGSESSNILVKVEELKNIKLFGDSKNKLKVPRKTKKTKIPKEEDKASKVSTSKKDEVPMTLTENEEVEPIFAENGKNSINLETNIHSLPSEINEENILSEIAIVTNTSCSNILNDSEKQEDLINEIEPNIEVKEIPVVSENGCRVQDELTEDDKSIVGFEMHDNIVRDDKYISETESDYLNINDQSKPFINKEIDNDAKKTLPDDELQSNLINKAEVVEKSRTNVVIDNKIKDVDEVNTISIADVVSPVGDIKHPKDSEDNIKTNLTDIVQKDELNCNLAQENKTEKIKDDQIPTEIKSVKDTETVSDIGTEYSQSQNDKSTEAHPCMSEIQVKKGNETENIKGKIDDVKLVTVREILTENEDKPVKEVSKHDAKQISQEVETTARDDGATLSGKTDNNIALDAKSAEIVKDSFNASTENSDSNNAKDQVDGVTEDVSHDKQMIKNLAADDKNSLIKVSKVIENDLHKQAELSHKMPVQNVESSTTVKLKPKSIVSKTEKQEELPIKSERKFKITKKIIKPIEEEVRPVEKKMRRPGGILSIAKAFEASSSNAESPVKPLLKKGKPKSLIKDITKSFEPPAPSAPVFSGPRRKSRDQWKMECDKALEEQPKGASKKDSIFSTTFVEFPEDIASSTEMKNAIPNVLGESEVEIKADNQNNALENQTYSETPESNLSETSSYPEVISSEVHNSSKSLTEVKSKTTADHSGAPKKKLKGSLDKLLKSEEIETNNKSEYEEKTNLSNIDLKRATIIPKPIQLSDDKNLDSDNNIVTEIDQVFKNEQLNLKSPLKMEDGEAFDLSPFNATTALTKDKYNGKTNLNQAQTNVIKVDNEFIDLNLLEMKIVQQKLEKAEHFMSFQPETDTLESAKTVEIESLKCDEPSQIQSKSEEFKTTKADDEEGFDWNQFEMEPTKSEPEQFVEISKNLELNQVKIESVSCEPFKYVDRKEIDTQIIEKETQSGKSLEPENSDGFDWTQFEQNPMECDPMNNEVTGVVNKNNLEENSANDSGVHALMQETLGSSWKDKDEEGFCLTELEEPMNSECTPEAESKNEKELPYSKEKDEEMALLKEEEKNAELGLLKENEEMKLKLEKNKVDENNAGASASEENYKAEKERLLIAIRSERETSKSGVLTDAEIPEYLDDLKDLLVPRARRKKQSLRYRVLDDIMKVPDTPEDIHSPMEIDSDPILDEYPDQEKMEVVSENISIEAPIEDVRPKKFLLTEEEEKELVEIQVEQEAVRAVQRREMERFLSMPDTLTELEEKELKELLDDEETDKEAMEMSKARLEAILDDVRKRIGETEDDYDDYLDKYMDLPTGLTAEEERLLSNVGGEEKDRKDFETDEEYREYIKQRYLDDLEEDRMRVEEEEFEFGEYYDDEDYEYEEEYLDEDYDMMEDQEDIPNVKKDAAVGSDEPEQVVPSELETTKRTKGFFDGLRSKTSKKNIEKQSSKDSSNEGSASDLLSESKQPIKFFRFGQKKEK